MERGVAGVFFAGRRGRSGSLWGTPEESGVACSSVIMILKKIKNSSPVDVGPTRTAMRSTKTRYFGRGTAGISTVKTFEKYARIRKIFLKSSCFYPCRPRAPSDALKQRIFRQRSILKTLHPVGERVEIHACQGDKSGVFSSVLLGHLFQSAGEIFQILT